MTGGKMAGSSCMPAEALPQFSNIQADNRSTRSSLHVPDKRGVMHDSTDNLDTISVRSYNSQASGFQYPRRYIKKLQHKSRTSNVVTGKKATNGDTSFGFRGAPEPDRHLFIYRAENDMSVNDVEIYLNNQNISYKSIECLSNPNAKFKSFKLTVSVSKYQQLFNDDIWPNGIRVRPFRSPKNIDHIIR